MVTSMQALINLRFDSCSTDFGGCEPQTSSISACAVRWRAWLHARWCMVWLRMGELSYTPYNRVSTCEQSGSLVMLLHAAKRGSKRAVVERLHSPSQIAGRMLL